LTSTLEGVRDQRHAPGASYPRESPGTHCTGGWVGLRASLDRCGKSRPHRNSTADRPARRKCYNDYATQPTVNQYLSLLKQKKPVPVAAPSKFCSIQMYQSEIRMATDKRC